MTTIYRGSLLDINHQSAALFGSIQHNRRFGNSHWAAMRGPMPKNANQIMRQERRPVQSMGYTPIVELRDLELSGGSRFSVDITSGIHGPPVVGRLEGRGKPISWASQEATIGYIRQAASGGDRRAQQRTSHDMVARADNALMEWFGRWEDQLCYVHAAGARGVDNVKGWEVPLETDPTFSLLTTNPILTPSKYRHFFAGDATTVADMDEDDYLTLGGLSQLALKLHDTDFPLQGIPIPGMQTDGDGNNGMLVMLAPPRVYDMLRLGQKSANSQSFQSWVAQATQRRMMKVHPLFQDESALYWQGLLVLRVGRPVRFLPGNTVKMTTGDDGTTTDYTVPNLGAASAAAAIADGRAVERCVILGYAALMEAYGGFKGVPKGTPESNSAASSAIGISGHMLLSRKWLDHGNEYESAGSMFEGKSVVRLAYEGDGPLLDYGRAVIDCYAPDPTKAAGAALTNKIMNP